MGLLDGGMQGIFGAAFGAVLPAGYLLRTTLTDDGEGSYTTSHAVHAIKGQVDQASERMRRAEGYTDGDMRVIVLQSGVAVEPNTDDLAILGGKVWALSGIQADPAITHWEMTGRLGVMPKPATSFTSPTADNTPTITGTGLAGASIDLGYGDSTITGAATVAANGTWSATLPELADGTYAIRARQTLGGVTSAWAPGGDLTVDATPPAIPVITTASPFVTTDTTPSIAGTMAADAVTVTIYLDGVEDGTATLGSGTWAYTFDELDIGAHSVTATATDAVGNESAASAALSLTVNAPLAISGAPATDAVVGTAYSFTPSIAGGVAPRVASLASGSLPAGLSLNTSTGAITGTPSASGIFAGIVIRVTDAEGSTADLAPFTLTSRAVWTPLSEAATLGLDIWWDGTDSAHVTLDGSQKASAWQDRIGGVVATQADASKRLSYNSANGYLETTSAAWLDIPGQANSHLTKWGLHVMWADLSGSGAADGTLWFLNGSGGADGNRKPLIDYRRSTIAIGAGWRANGNYNIAIVNLPGDDAWHIGLTRLNGGVNKTSVNGGNEVTTGSGISLPVGTSIAGMIGDYRWGLIGNGLTNWRVRHILTGTADISSTLRDKLVGWAAWEGGLQALLPTGHPYKAQRPLVDP